MTTKATDRTHKPRPQHTRVDDSASPRQRQRHASPRQRQRRAWRQDGDDRMAIFTRIASNGKILHPELYKGPPAVTTVTNIVKKHKPKPRWKSEIRKQQNSTELCIGRAPFFRVVKEILEEIDQDNDIKHKISKPALMALQEATEAHVVRLMTLATHCTVHGARVTLQKKDFDLVKKIRDDDTSLL